MDKIWYRNHSKSEVIGRCDADEKTEMTKQKRQKSNAIKNPMNMFILLKSDFKQLNFAIRYRYQT